MEEGKEFKNLEIPKEVEQKGKAILEKANKFKDSALKSYKKEIISIEILPPKPQPSPELIQKGLAQPVNPDEIDIFVILDDSKSDVQPDYKIKDKITPDLMNKAKAIDKNLFLDVMLMSEFKESCYDSRYEILNLVAKGLVIYDPFDFIAAIKVSEVHKVMVLKKFDRYITSYLAAGSLFRGEKSNDIDVYIVVDDTDVKRMTRPELRDKLRAMIISMGYEASAITGVQKQFHIQVYILTDYWEWLKDANPVIFTVLRDAVPLYDRGMFNAWRLLLKMGRIKPSSESIEMNMDLGRRLLDRSKKRLSSIVLEDLFWAAMNPSQAAVMLYGLNPTTPKETIKAMEEVFVKKEKILEQKYVNMLEKVRKFFKDIEHGKVTEVSAVKVDSLIKEVDVYLKRIERLFNQIKKKRDKEQFGELYETVVRITKDILIYAKYKVGTDLSRSFKKYVSENNIPVRQVNYLKEILNAKSKFSKLNKAELDKVQRNARIFLNRMNEHYQSLRFDELSRVKLQFRYAKHIGEIYLLDKVAYIVPDVQAKEKEMQKAKLTKKGIGKIEASEFKEFEKAISEAKIPSKVVVPTNLVDDLKKVFGEDLELVL